jgi:signal transduction histidine kinase
MTAIHNLLCDWSAEIAQFIDRQGSANVLALLDRQGQVIYANAEMRRLLHDETTGDFQLERLVSPSWQTLTSMNGQDRQLYNGWLTFDSPNAVSRSLRGEVWRRAEHWLILAAYDVDDLVRVNQQIINMNAEMTNLQRELARKNAALSNTLGQLSIINQQLEQEILERRLIEDRLRHYNQELQAHNEELDAYAHTVAHDLKNPLGIILGYAALLQSSGGMLEPEQSSRILDHIIEGSQQMGSIINELLLLASTRTMDKIDVRPLDMEQVAAKALLRLQKMIDDHQAQVISHDGAPWPRALGYAPWVEEVWVNYVSNAIKYGGTPPQIEIGVTHRHDNTAHFWVRDNGSGIDPQQQGLLFSPFSRLDESRSEGHGLGLSIVKRIVQRLGGSVEVQSEIGQGSEFGFVLPLGA